jgi:hypothetical protein
MITLTTTLVPQRTPGPFRKLGAPCRGLGRIAARRPGGADSVVDSSVLAEDELADMENIAW